MEFRRIWNNQLNRSNFFSSFFAPFFSVYEAKSSTCGTLVEICYLRSLAREMTLFSRFVENKSGEETSKNPTAWSASAPKNMLYE